MNDNNKSGIYCVENIITNKKYIGQSNNIEHRWKQHVSELNNNSHFNDYLQKAWNKYGQDNFKFYVLTYCDIEELDKNEIYYIKYYNTINRNYGYNLKTGGQFGGSCLSDESRKKLSESLKKSYLDPNQRQIQRINALNQWSNKEIKEKISGENNGMYGKHHTNESKKKISEARKGVQSPRRNKNQVICIELNKVFKDATEASKELSLDSSCILKVCRGERKTCGRYYFEFLNNWEI